MIVTINSNRLNLQESDEVEIEEHECGRCETTHTEITVRRNGKKIASLGEYITLGGEDEVYGGVIVDVDNNVLPDYHSVTHIFSCMTEDRKYYAGMCGTVLDHSPENSHDRMTSAPSHLTSKEKKRLCPKCLEIYQCKER